MRGVVHGCLSRSEATALCGGGILGGRGADLRRGDRDDWQPEPAQRGLHVGVGGRGLGLRNSYDCPLFRGFAPHGQRGQRASHDAHRNAKHVGGRGRERGNFSNRHFCAHAGPAPTGNYFWSWIASVRGHHGDWIASVAVVL